MLRDISPLHLRHLFTVQRDPRFRSRLLGILGLRAFFFFLTRFYPHRKMMDSGQIDFYQHSTVCSNTCRSTKFDVVVGNARVPSGGAVQMNPSCLVLDPLGGQMPPLTGRPRRLCCCFYNTDTIYRHVQQAQHLTDTINCGFRRSGTGRAQSPDTSGRQVQFGNRMWLQFRL